MKTWWLAAMAALVVVDVQAAAPDIDEKVREMVDRSFREQGIARKERMLQLDFHKFCSALERGVKVDLKTIAALQEEQAQTIKMPSDGKFFGDWKKGEQIAQSGRGLTWTDAPGTVNGGGCYNCHQLDMKELSYGNIGPSLSGYGKLRGNAPEIIEYTWKKIWNGRALNLCSSMPRYGDAGILTEAQIKDVMAYLFDPESPVNKNHK